MACFLHASQAGSTPGAQLGEHTSTREYTLRYGPMSIAMTVVVVQRPKDQLELHSSEMVDRAQVAAEIQTSLLSEVLAFLSGIYAFEWAGVFDD